MTDQNALVVRPDEPELTPFQVIERVITSGDLAQMKPEDRVAFYWRTCESLGLNPLTRPFLYLNLDGKLVLYATKDATEQLRKINHVSVTSITRQNDVDLGLYTVIAHVRAADGREDEASGVVNVKGMAGNFLANAIMKAETKAKRRATLSLVGLGFLDESEVADLGGDANAVDVETGRIRETPPKPTLLETVQQQADVLASDATLAAEPAASVSPSGASAEDGAFMAEPMSPETSATIATVEESEDDLIAAAHAEQPEVHELSVQGLATLARAGKINKARFAEVLDCVPADVGKLIEAMTDGQRYDLASDLGILP